MAWRFAAVPTTAKEAAESAVLDVPPSSFAAWRRWSPLLLVLLLLFGTAIRLRQFFACPSYWYDEAYLLVNIYDKPCRELFGPLRAQQVMAPLLLCLLRGLYAALGGAEWVMRLPATAASLAALGLMFFLARRILGSPGALLAVGLGTFSHHAMVHANEVHPYSSDFLLTEAILLVGIILLRPSSPDSSRGWCRIGLLLLAGLAPWISFPSALVLGAVSLALLLDVGRRGDRVAWLYWILLNGLLLLSGFSLWWFHARHLYSLGLHDFWVECGGFPNGHSPRAILDWSIRCLIGIGDYGTTSLGIPLLILGLLGAACCWRRSPPLAVLLSGPIGLGWLMALVGRYPMADRTVFFAVPCVWLLALLGVEAVANRAGSRRASVAVLLALVLLVPGSIRACKYLVLVGTKSDFRNAFVYVDQNRHEQDLCWVSHPEVFEVYYRGRRTCLGSYTPANQLVTSVRGARLWVITPPETIWQGPYGQAIPEFLGGFGMRLTSRRQFTGLDVLLFEPISNESGEREM